METPNQEPEPDQPPEQPGDIIGSQSIIDGGVRRAKPKEEPEEEAKADSKGTTIEAPIANASGAPDA